MTATPLSDPVLEAEAAVSFLPWQNGDGYSFGGGTILTIGTHSYFMGTDRESEVIAKEIANRWNAARQLEALRDKENSDG